jgi:hypothetical protein
MRPHISRERDENMIGRKVNFNNGYWPPHFSFFYESQWIDGRFSRWEIQKMQTKSCEQKKDNGALEKGKIDEPDIMNSNKRHRESIFYRITPIYVDVFLILSDSSSFRDESRNSFDAVGENAGNFRFSLLSEQQIPWRIPIKFSRKLKIFSRKTVMKLVLISETTTQNGNFNFLYCLGSSRAGFHLRASQLLLCWGWVNALDSGLKLL